ncbi:MAG: peptidoglycan editing factor PgeF [Clostridia bacterium]|jgi:YfiH family protein|nr:peptidoglycan editing factor PgeF [Clostridia bacterium]
MNRLADSLTLKQHVVEGVGYYTFPAFDAFPFVRHGFSTRIGGVSEGIFESMNLSFTRGDEEANVRENFERFCAAVGVDSHNAVVAAQEHHTVIYNATANDRGRGVYRERGYRDIDGLLTDEPQVVLFTQYADCVPLFFLDPVRRVVGTAHAGWRGTVAKIGAAMVERMCRDYGCRREDILAAIGPSIGPCCFEVDEPVYNEFSALPAASIVRQNGEKYWIDLWETNRRVLLDAGIRNEHITVTDLCTKCHRDVFWSHRATGGKRGSLVGCIALV